MRLLVSRTAVVTVMLALAGAVAVCAPLGRSMVAQSTATQTTGMTRHLGRRFSSRAGKNVGYLSSGINGVKMNAMFMDIGAHRANILGAYHYVGVAWVVAPNRSAYIAVRFG